MSKVIIGIHGLGNKPSKKILEEWWLSAMAEGIAKTNKSCKIPKFELVYWADILYEQPLDVSLNEKLNPLFIQEKYSPGSKDFVPESHTVRQKFLDFLEKQLDKLFLNADFTINYVGITDAILRMYFKDLEVYYAKVCTDENDIRCKARTLIRQRLVDTLHKYRFDEIFLIGHSMGSIVAFDVLTFLVPHNPIHSFVSLGSPLGFPVIQGKIAAEWLNTKQVPPELKTPPGIRKHWYNFADLKDKIALVYDLSDNFQPNGRGVAAEDFIVNNDFITESTFNPHKSYGYLRTLEFAEALIYFCEEKIPFGKRLKGALNKFISEFS